MSTHAMIYIEYYNEDSPKYKAIYCHADGYLSRTGKILMEYYNSTEKVESLIKADIEGFNEDGSFEKFYDDDSKTFRIYNSESDFPELMDDHYLWDSEEECWYHSDWDYHKWKKLEDELKSNGIEIESDNTLKLIKEISDLSEKTNLMINGNNYIKTKDILNLIKENSK